MFILQNAKTQIRECENTKNSHWRIFLEFGHSLAVKRHLDKTNYLGCPCGHFKSHGLIFPKRHIFSFNSLTYWISHDGKEWRRNDSLRVTSLVYWMTHARCIVIGHHRGEWKSLSDYTTVVSISETYQNLKHYLRHFLKRNI